MGKAPALNDLEKAQILLLKKQENSISYISREINRSRGVIGSFLADPEGYGTKNILDGQRSSERRQGSELFNWRKVKI